MLSILRRLRPRLLILASVGSIAALAFWYFIIRTPRIPQRTLRIGFEQVPPVQIRTRNGFSGLAVETVSEAAKRAGVSLHWVETGTSSEEALRRGLLNNDELQKAADELDKWIERDRRRFVEEQKARAR